MRIQDSFSELAFFMRISHWMSNGSLNIPGKKKSIISRHLVISTTICLQLVNYHDFKHNKGAAPKKHKRDTTPKKNTNKHKGVQSSL